MPASSASLSKALDALSGFFLGDATLSQTLQKVADLACAMIPSTAMVGITMLAEGKASAAGFTDEAVSEIESAQYETGVGPCLDAFRDLQVYRIEDMEADRHWPEFSRCAAGHGITSSMSVPLVARDGGIGALTFYSRVAHAYSEEDVRVGFHFATHAAIVLANAQAYAQAQQLGLDMVQAMQSRATIEQAKGIFMAAQHCSADDAFQILVRASQRENRKLREIADDIVARTIAGNAKAKRTTEISGRSMASGHRPFA